MTEKKAIPVKEGLFTIPAAGENGHLLGTKCHSCEEVFFGRAMFCSHCQSNDLEETWLSDRGRIYNYTILRYPPPAPWKGPSDPYEPFAAGFVELPEGLRILSIFTDCDVEKLHTHMEVELTVRKYYEDEEGNDVYTYMFRPVYGS